MFYLFTEINVSALFVIRHGFIVHTYFTRKLCKHEGIDEL